MYKKIGLSLVSFSLFAGLYGCSCSQKPTVTETAPGLYITDVTVTEGDSGSTEYSAEVNLQRENQDVVTVTYEIEAIAVSVNSVATGGVDFKEETNILKFDAESGDSQSISFTVYNDLLYEHSEDFLITLTAASGANIVNGQARVTIVDNDPMPVASFSVLSDLASTTFAENEVERIQLEVALNTESGVDAEVIINKTRETELNQASVGKTATHRVDYLLKDADENLMKLGNVVIPAGETKAVVNLDIVDDGISENTESFTLTLDEVVDVKVSSADLSFEITDNDNASMLSQLSIPLNDTGLSEVNAVDIDPDTDLDPSLDPEFAVSQLTDELRGEMDIAFGRDAAVKATPPALTKVGSGRTGFDFTKIKSDGSVTTDTAPDEDGAVIPWDCVRDNNTGLVWEVKTRGNLGLRAVSRNFRWYDPNFETNGGVEGEQGDFSCDATDLSACNTAYYIADLNANKLCGLSGWRLPTIHELRSIVDYNIHSSQIEVAYDTDYFAGDTNGVKFIWSSTSFAPDPTKAWTIRFGQGVEEQVRDKTQYVESGIRLVNDSLIKQAQQ